ncbi:MAG: hypothetical protein AB7D39_14975 [Pseudodesulfovibrio sp.]|uniref:Nmad2 family putative nucleotide modification protein n=1 Tax=Pseudodesulfovibrio sp. TaxID=2035812 RepID=UPI003D127A76
MRGFAYVIPRDYGFAPNPFGMYCTLATCKQDVRARAVVGDWVVGCGSARFQLQGHVVFAMRVCEKLTFDQYWNDPRFHDKKPIMSGSLKRMYGDNIYHHIGGGWRQEDSHHSMPDGIVNTKNLNRDTSSDSVLLASEFYYFGRSAIIIEDNNLARAVTWNGRGYKNINAEPLNDFVSILRNTFDVGLIDIPILFDRFERYDGN